MTFAHSAEVVSLKRKLEKLEVENAALREKVERTDKWFADHASVLAAHRLGGFYMTPPTTDKEDQKG